MTLYSREYVSKHNNKCVICHPKIFNFGPNQKIPRDKYFSSIMKYLHETKPGITCTRHIHLGQPLQFSQCGCIFCLSALKDQCLQSFQLPQHSHYAPHICLSGTNSGNIYNTKCQLEYMVEEHNLQWTKNITNVILAPSQTKASDMQDSGPKHTRSTNSRYKLLESREHNFRYKHMNKQWFHHCQLRRFLVAAPRSY